MERDDINRIASDALNKAEKGDKAGLSKELDSIPFQDRLEVVKQMQEQAKQAHDANPSLPTVEFEAVHAGDGDHVKDLYVNNGERSYFNPARWFGDKYDKDDVYTAEPGTGSGLLFTAMDSVKSAALDTNAVIAQLNRGN